MTCVGSERRRRALSRQSSTAFQSEIVMSNFKSSEAYYAPRFPRILPRSVCFTHLVCLAISDFKPEAVFFMGKSIFLTLQLVLITFVIPFPQSRHSLTFVSRTIPPCYHVVVHVTLLASLQFRAGTLVSRRARRSRRWRRTGTR